VKQRPILFSTEMVRAIIAGRKTMTRRVVKPQPESWVKDAGYTFFTPIGKISFRGTHPEKGLAEYSVPLKFGVPGDHLWVKESWAVAKEYNHLPPSKLPKGIDVWYMAEGPKPSWAGRTRSGRFMPRWASRITLEITGVRVERVRAISEDDAIAEGVEPFRIRRTGYAAVYDSNYREGFRLLWDTINAAPDRTWDANPWVWVLSFKVLP
jgi:hypothetical protein